MSILIGPFERNDISKKAGDDDDDLLMFGYACKLYRDDTKAIMENSGQLLIPWMGDNSLMVDRYDVRNRLDDKAQFGLKSNLPRRKTNEEEELENKLDKERYLALEWDEIRVEEQEEEEKRRFDNPFSAVSFTYTEPILAHDSVNKSRDSDSHSNSNLHLPGHLPTSTVDCGDDDRFVPPRDLVLPEGIQIPSTNKLHSIIVKTASFVSKQGTQMEIIIKTKQKLNPFFSFLDYRDNLFPYYKYLKEMITAGTYKEMITAGTYIPDPKRETEKNSGATEGGGRFKGHRDNASDSVTRDNGGRTVIKEKGGIGTGDKENLAAVRHEENASDLDSDDDSGYLHPLLMNTSLNASKPLTPERAPPTSTSESQRENVTDKKLSVDELMNLHRNASFVTKSLAINSAPSLSSTQGQVTSDHGNSVDSEALAAYEYYRRQFYTSPMGPAPGEEAWSTYHPSDIGPLPSHDAHGSHHQYLNVEHGPQPFPTPQGYVPPPFQYQAPYYNPHCPPEGYLPPELKSIVDKTAEYVAKNSDDFERTVLQRHADDPRFGFLNPWDCYHSYYQAMKQYFRSILEQGGVFPMQEEIDGGIKPNVQKLSSSGTVSFKLHSKDLPTASLLTPCSSEFGGEESEDVVESDAEDDANVVQDQPPPKRQRLNDPKGNGEEMGSTVEVFLSAVKGLFGSEYTISDNH